MWQDGLVSFTLMSVAYIHVASLFSLLTINYYIQLMLWRWPVTHLTSTATQMSCKNSTNCPRLQQRPNIVEQNFEAAWNFFSHFFLYELWRKISYQTICWIIRILNIFVQSVQSPVKTMFSSCNIITHLLESRQGKRWIEINTPSTKTDAVSAIDSLSVVVDSMSRSDKEKVRSSSAGGRSASGPGWCRVNILQQLTPCCNTTRLSELNKSEQDASGLRDFVGWLLNT